MRDKEYQAPTFKLLFQHRHPLTRYPLKLAVWLGLFPIVVFCSLLKRLHLLRDEAAEADWVPAWWRLKKYF